MLHSVGPALYPLNCQAVRSSVSPLPEHWPWIQSHSLDEPIALNHGWRSPNRHPAASQSVKVIVKRFAKEISNKVFLYGSGIIYEEGTPEQIFDIL